MRCCCSGRVCRTDNAIKNHWYSTSRRRKRHAAKRRQVQVKDGTDNAAHQLVRRSLDQQEHKRETPAAAAPPAKSMSSYAALTVETESTSNIISSGSRSVFYYCLAMLPSPVSVSFPDSAAATAAYAHSLASPLSLDAHGNCARVYAPTSPPPPLQLRVSSRSAVSPDVNRVNAAFWQLPSPLLLPSPLPGLGWSLRNCPSAWTDLLKPSAADSTTSPSSPSLPLTSASVHAHITSASPTLSDAHDKDAAINDVAATVQHEQLPLSPPRPPAHRITHHEYSKSRVAALRATASSSSLSRRPRSDSVDLFLDCVELLASKRQCCCSNRCLDATSCELERCTTVGVTARER